MKSNIWVKRYQKIGLLDSGSCGRQAVAHGGEVENNDSSLVKDVVKYYNDYIQTGASFHNQIIRN